MFSNLTLNSEARAWFIVGWVRYTVSFSQSVKGRMGQVGRRVLAHRVFESMTPQLKPFIS